jgi:hypothetical protein
MPGSSSWMPYAPQGVKGFDDEWKVFIRVNVHGSYTLDKVNTLRGFTRPPWWTFEDGNHRTSRSIGVLRCVQSQKSADLLSEVRNLVKVSSGLNVWLLCKCSCSQT